MNLRISIMSSKNFRTKQFKNNLWENTNIQKKNIQKQTLLHAMAMASKGLLTKINEDDTIRNSFIYQRISWVSKNQGTFSSRSALWENGTC